MRFQAVIHDFRLNPSADSFSACSLLTLPLDRRTLLSHLADALSGVDCTDCLVVPAFDADDAYADALADAAPGLRFTVVRRDQCQELFAGGDSSDTLLFVDPGYWPVDGLDPAALVRAHAEDLAAVFLTGSPHGAGNALERVVTDSGGNLRRIQRVFQPLKWAHAEDAVVAACVVPRGAALDHARFPLAGMRRRLSSRGLPIRDVPAPNGFFDLRRPDEILRLSQKMLLELRSAQRRDRSDQDGVFVDPAAIVAPSARIVGDVVVHRGALLAEESVVIGPAVVGRSAVVGARAVVAHCVIADRAVVRTDAVVHQQIYSGSGGTEPPVPADPMPTASEDDYRVVRDGKVESVGPRPAPRITSAIKRTTDVVLAVVGLIAAAPLMLLVAGLIKANSPGPVIFAHRREGKNGREFGCLKFRTMRPDADQLQRALGEQNVADGPQFVIENDPRVTSIGRFLRKTNLDELPQLFNVLLGHMSLVGPRPSPFRENQICAPWRRARLSVRPGITGLWQICRHRRDEGDFHQWIYFDIAYVRNMSPLLDWKILWHTLRTLGGARSVSMEKLIPGECDHEPLRAPVQARVRPSPS